MFSPDKVYYIGDSKYYRDATGPKEDSHSTFKQFTYVRNIVNDLIFGNEGETWPYRDSLTEGYVVVPNFFINSRINASLKYETDDIECQDAEVARPFQFRHFVNRLFDRDTLWVRQYNLNFLYLISVYASSNNTETERFKAKARKFFRERTIALLNEKYEFWILTPKVTPIPDEVKWQLRGMCYSLDGAAKAVKEEPKSEEASKVRLIFAIQKPDELEPESVKEIVNLKINGDFEQVKPIIRAYFDYQSCILSPDKSVVKDNPDRSSLIFDFDKD